MSNIIKFYKGEETGIVHENYNEKETSLFKDQYNKALKEIDTYIRQVEEWKQKHDNEDDFDINNIFVFIGERGTGKTSCMESVARMLKKLSETEEKEGLYPKIENSSFQIIKTIDPTTFDIQTNILEAIIGSMYNDFNEFRRNNFDFSIDSNNRDKGTHIVDLFQKLKNGIKSIAKQDYYVSMDISEISQLSDFSDVIDLRYILNQLIKEYLEYIGRTILVIKIDDIDLQVSHAYKMIEHIRKYLIQENVVIMISAHYDQLSTTVELELTKKYSYLLNTKRMSSNDIADMTFRFLLKLLPVSHRIYMPIVESYANRELNYFENRDERNLLFPVMSMKYAVTSLIFQKCRYLFYHSKGETSPIVPNNLRELRNLLALLVDMPSNDDKDTYDSSQNKERFLHYFNNTWVNSSVIQKDKKIVDAILNIKNVVSTNKTILNLLKVRYNEILSDEESIKEILNDKNVTYNISISDVFTVLDQIKQKTVDLADKKLIFFIETYYSIKLYGYYKELTHNIDYSSIINLNVSNTIIRREIIADVNNYELLVGGLFINSDVYNLAPKEFKTGLSRAKRKINYSQLVKMADIIVSEFCIDSYKLQLVEFFALCISRVLESNNNTANKDYRQHRELFYQYFGKNDVRTSRYLYAEFDLGAFFFNVLNIKRAYDRINPGLYGIATNTKVPSLYNALLRACRGDCPNYDNNRRSILSCTLIRNMEVLYDFIKYIEFGRLQRSVSKSNRKNIIYFFNQVQAYNIQTYDYNEGSDSSRLISFNYAKVICDALNIQEENRNMKYDIISDECCYAPFRNVEHLENDADMLFDSIFVVEEMQELKNFNVEQIVNSFRYFPIKVQTLRLKVNTYCKGILSKNAPAKKGWSDLLREYANVENLSKEEVENILNRFKVTYSLK